ncbi:MAG: ribulose-phosphate 3-epimerase, ribulose-phosphate 3-epimerase [Parcubacteria group bacterium]|nr:ribulose-phosphate 3-epimerase, ribulose-phosphate 3-epimerase [Parcubacteria group bacterium]
MNIIIPAVLPISSEDLQDKLLRLQGFAKNVQVDLVDGVFASPASWPFTTPGKIDEQGQNLDALEFLGALHMELDLMVTDPEACIDPWITAGANRITIHAESTRVLPKILSDIKTKYGHDVAFMPGLLSIGLAIHASTEISLIEPFLNQVDYVQFMGIDTIGRQGEPFDARILPKLRAFKKKYPKMPVQVDGGVSLETAPALLSAGVSRLIVGSAIWKAKNVETAYAEFEELTTRYGIYT